MCLEDRDIMLWFSLLAHALARVTKGEKSNLVWCVMCVCLEIFGTMNRDEAT
jgi:hypothetical protein